jgi:uncharacterized phiE125 gp8 family phage protein
MIVISSVTTKPTLGVVTVHEVKKQARVDEGYEDTEIEGMLAAAEATVEAICRRSFRPQTWTTYYKDVQVGTPERLIRPPVTSAVVSYRDSATTWADATCTTIIEGDQCLWYPPSGTVPYNMTDGSPNWKAVVVCGGTLDDFPAPIKQAILILATHLYEQRTPIIIGTIVADVPLSVSSLLAPFTIPSV